MWNGDFSGTGLGGPSKAAVGLPHSEGAALRLGLCALTVAIALFAAFHHAQAESLKILPEQITLTGPEASHRFLALKMDGEFAGKSRPVAFTTSDPAVVSIGPDGVAVASGNGDATITALASGGESATADVTVRGFTRAHAWSFRNHVLPVITKADCNSGGCHGALAGKGGFALSLMAYAPLKDYHTITRGARGRRVELADPARSLLLTKPTAAAKHKGGRRLDPGSRDYQIVAEWIAAGAAPPTEADAAIARIEVIPALSLLAPGDSQQLVVRAFYSDGRVEDVTQWARFTAADESVARVDKKTGELQVVGHGEGAVTAWFSSRIVMARVTSPFPNKIPDAVFTKAPRRNFIDDLVLDQLRQLHLEPSPRAGDTEFIRRAWLDTIGMLPTPEETRAFLDSGGETSKKRDRVIEALLARPEFVDYWTYRWSDLFLISGRNLRPDALKAYYEWLRGEVAANTPWDGIARQVLTAKGGSIENGATNFYAVHQDPETMAENVSQVFMALSINCAKCHNHPLEKWTNDQYYAFANLFARVRAKGWGGDARSGDGIRTLYLESRGDLDQPRTGKPQVPAPLDGDPVPVDDTGDRRAHLADWLTSPENPYFTRAIANRVWAAFFGKGLVNPVDDLRASNPASNAPLLDALAAYLVEHRYDLKSLMRVILQSETYQRSSVALAGNRDDTKYFSHYYPRRLMAEVLHDAIAGVTEVPGDFTDVILQDGSGQKTEFYPKGTRALELYDSAVGSYFLKIFGRNERAIACECERSDQPSMVQVLHLSNGTTVNEKLASEESRVTRMLGSGHSDAEMIEDAFFLCLSRAPTARERSGLEKMFAEMPGDEKRVAVEDLFWALMTSREFLFQH